MSYLSAKKIYPGNWAGPLNSWYKNIDDNGAGVIDASKGGPTSVLAIPGYRYFQSRGYVPVTATSGSGPVASASVIVPSPYRQDDTRTDITGLVISGNATQSAYVYRTAISVASGWGDGRVASGIYAAAGSPVAYSGEPTAQANLASTVSGTQAGEILFAGGVQAFGNVPLLTATGQSVTVTGLYPAYTAATTFKVFSKASGNAVTTAGGFYISSGDSTAGRTGYLCVEVCYIVPDDAPGYEDIDGYLTGRTVS